MKTPVKVMLITTGVVVLGLLAALIYILNNPSASSTPSSDGPPQVVRPNSHVLDDGGADAVELVEFMDFECEACGAFYPVVEQLREKYAGEITYVIRYFPLRGHMNSTNAAVAVEAASQQDRLEDMYRVMFETQAEWGEAQESKADLFRRYAEDLGLDMAAYDAAVADPATLERVEFDVNEGKSLGIDSTPTFFIDGEKVALQQFGDLESELAAAIASRE